MWFLSLFIATPGKVNGMVQGDDFTDVLCQDSAYLQDNKNCILSAPNNSYFFHDPTNSYQRKLTSVFE